MLNKLQPKRWTRGTRRALRFAAIPWLAMMGLAIGLTSAGCDGEPVAERAGEESAQEGEVAAGPTDLQTVETELPLDSPSEGGDTPVASDIAPAAYDEPAAAGSGDQQPAGDSPPVEPPSESTTDSGGSHSAAPEASAEPTAEPAAAKPPMRPPADRTPRRPGEAEKISFDDLNLGMAADMVYRPFLLNDRVKELDGQKVSILGYIHAGATGNNVKEFVLLKNTECKFGAGGQADHLAMVYLAPGQTTKYQLGAIKVEGKLVVKPYQGPDGNTWSVYDLVEAKVVR